MKPPIEYRPKAKRTGEMPMSNPVRPAAVSRAVQTTVAQAKSAPTFDKTAYQREYMRKRRAALKCLK